MNLKVSVITVCYNAEKFIEYAINSVLKQTYKDIEYIIIDGASTDNTISIVNKYNLKISFFSSEPDEGIYDAMNKGINVATGDILYFLNSDDRFYDNYVVENVIKLFQTDEKLDLIYGNIVLYNPITKESFIKIHENVSKMYFSKNVICQQAVFFKKKLFMKCGLFDTSYQIVGDHEWELRAFCKNNIAWKYHPIIIANYMDGGMSSPSKSLELANKERRKVVEKYFNRQELLKYKFILLAKLILKKME
jgi:glycosyltransferase involved in cell wall biosynthesis